jgi:hypothetical protein
MPDLEHGVDVGGGHGAVQQQDAVARPVEPAPRGSGAAGGKGKDEEKGEERGGDER